MPRNITRRTALLALAALGALSACSPAATGSSGSESPTDGPIYFGVSGPLTGPSAEYGEYWKEGFDLALAAAERALTLRGAPVPPPGGEQD